MRCVVFSISFNYIVVNRDGANCLLEALYGFYNREKGQALLKVQNLGSMCYFIPLRRQYLTHKSVRTLPKLISIVFYLIYSSENPDRKKYLGG